MKDRHRSQLASVRLRPEEKALVETLAARQGSTVSALLHGLLRAEAFRQGNLGIMDYYRMQNVKADTEMRSSLAKDGTEKA